MGLILGGWVSSWVGESQAPNPSPSYSGHQCSADYVLESTLAHRARAGRARQFSGALVWPLKLGLRTPTLRCGHLSGPPRTRGGFFDFEVGGHDGAYRVGCM